MPATTSDDFYDDSPLVDGKGDRLNRAPFADRVASVLRGLPTGASLVVGIHGPWGDGKTTVLNMVRRILDGDDSVVVRDFNPWRLVDDDAMLRGFFAMLAEAMGASLVTKAESRKAKAGTWLLRTRWLTKPVGMFYKPVDSLDGLLASLGEAATKRGSVGLEERRDRVVQKLKTSRRRIVVLIDDLDRLDRHETHMLFRLVKACADFPNVSYVLAFDDVAVAKALGDRYGGGGEMSGRSFLEKIIQLPLQLPVAAKEDLRTLCFEHVDQVLASAGIEATETEVGEFVTGFDRGVSIRLTTPRAAHRFGNGLRFVLPTLVGETNLADMLLVEAMRAFFPEVYAVVRNHHEDFSGVQSDHLGHQEPDDRAAKLLEPVLQGMAPGEAEAAKLLVGDLFPRLSSTHGHSSYGSGWAARWSRERRVSSPQYCARYFTYAVPHNDVADSVVAAILEAARKGSVEDVRDLLAPILDGSTAARVIEKLRAVESTVDETVAETLAAAIAPLGVGLPNPPALFSFSQPLAQAGILISHLLARIPQQDRRVAVAKRIVETAEPISFGGECLRWLYVTDKPEKQDANALSEADTADVRRVLVDRIKARAEAGAALFDPQSSEEQSLLFEWWRAEGRDPVQFHLLRVFARDPHQIAAFLQSMAPRSWTGGEVSPRVGDLHGDQLKSMKLLIDLDVLAELIREHCPGDFDGAEWSYDERPVEQRLSEQFMFIYNQWQREGEPPDRDREHEAESSDDDPSEET